MSTTNGPCPTVTPGAALHRDITHALDHLVTTRPNATITELYPELGRVLRHLVDGTLAVLENLERAHYEERSLLLSALSTHPDLIRALLTVDSDSRADPRRTTVLVLDADTGRMAWHVDDRDVPELAHLAHLTHLAQRAPHEPEARWDGADKPTTLDRLRGFVRRQARRAADNPRS